MAVALPTTADRKTQICFRLRLRNRVDHAVFIRSDRSRLCAWPRHLGEVPGCDKEKYGSERARFLLFNQYEPSERIDLAYCNGVFHHIPPSRRVNVVNYIFRLLRPGGLFALWENNPWNPGTRYVMSRIPFDRDAITLTAPETRRLLRAGRFEILRTDFLFIFPRILSWFRCVEPLVAQIPLGAQYQILCRKPVSKKQ